MTELTPEQIERLKAHRDKNLAHWVKTAGPVRENDLGVWTLEVTFSDFDALLAAVKRLAEK